MRLGNITPPGGSSKRFMNQHLARTTGRPLKLCLRRLSSKTSLYIWPRQIQKSSRHGRLPTALQQCESMHYRSPCDHKCFEDPFTYGRGRFQDCSKGSISHRRTTARRIISFSQVTLVTQLAQNGSKRVDTESEHAFIGGINIHRWRR